MADSIRMSGFRIGSVAEVTDLQMGSTMRSLLTVVLVCLASIPVLSSQEPSPQYERGTIVAVSRHPSDPNAPDDTAKYDVSVKVRDTMYVVLYEPPHGANMVEYAAGMDLLVSVGEDTLTFPSKLTGTTHVPILRKEALPPEPIVDWSKAPSRYFEMKMRNLTENLDLSREQQSKIKPIIEQEAFESSQFCFETSIPKNERLKRLEKVVRSSDVKLKAVLTPVQWEKLQELRKDQKNELKAMIAGQANGK